MRQRLRYLVQKEFIQIRRDRQLLAMIMFAPIFQLFIFGYAVTTDVKHVSTAIVDLDHGQAGRVLVNKLSAAGYFDIEHWPASTTEAQALLDRGRAQVAITIPRGFSENLARGRTAQVLVTLDGTDASTANVVMGYLLGVAQRYSEEIVVRRLERLGLGARELPIVRNQLTVWYNPDLKSVNYMVPGVLCLILMVVTMVMTSVAIVREREVGTLEQLVVTPIRPIELMIGKVTPFVAIGFVDVLFIICVAHFWFKVPIAGDLLLLLALTVVFLSVSLGLGLFVSTVSRTQQQAIMTSFFIMIPSILLSGFVFPIRNMPLAIQYLTYIIPLRYYLAIVRGIFLKGVGLGVLWPQVAALAGLGLLILTLSVLRFSKRLG